MPVAVIFDRTIRNTDELVRSRLHLVLDVGACSTGGLALDFDRWFFVATEIAEAVAVADFAEYQHRVRVPVPEVNELRHIQIQIGPRRVWTGKRSFIVLDRGMMSFCAR